MTITHTPGPWTYSGTAGHESHGQSIVIPEKEGRTVCLVYDGPSNASLIAAAPDLLDILDRILRAHESNNNGSVMGEAVLCQSLAIRAREAINKAKGL